VTEPESVWFIVQRTPVGDLPAIVHDPKKGKPSDWGVIYSLRLDKTYPHWVNELTLESMTIAWQSGDLPGQRGNHNAG
jgi:hypothetical protein